MPRRVDHDAGAPLSLRSACWAPHSALYLRPDGLVHACCATGHAIGSLSGRRRQTLREIWESAALLEHRRYLEAGRFDLGCQECEWVNSTGGREASLAVNFDRFGSSAPHRFPKMMDLALSNRCNLQYVMCNGDLLSSIRARREGRPPLPVVYDDEFFRELDEFLPHLEVIHFKGGEPFLASENRRVWDRLIDLRLAPEISVTTNGTIFNEHVERYISELDMRIVVSVDAVSPSELESIRVGVDARQLWSNIGRLREVACADGRGMSLSFCLMRSNWAQLMPFLAESERLDIDCNVVVVKQPGVFSLLGVGPDEVQEVIAGIEGDDRRLQEGGAAYRAREQVLERLTSQLDPSQEFAVRAGGSPIVPVDHSVRVQLVSDLTARYGSAPLILRVVDGLVRSMDVPDWAQWLQPEMFLGGRLGELGQILEANVGTLTASVVDSGISKVEAVEVNVDRPDVTRKLFVHDLVDASTMDEWVMISEGPEEMVEP